MLRIALLLSCLVSSLHCAPYVSLSSGGTIPPADPSHEIDSYRIFIHGLDEKGAPTYRTDDVSVKGDYDAGHRISFAIGCGFCHRYRAEWETTYARDHVSLAHVGPNFIRKDKRKWRRSGSVMVNVGGTLFPVSFMHPYSLVGVGGRVTCVDGKPPEAHLAYQWITGVEIPMCKFLSVLVQHRMQKSVRHDSLYSLEIGIKAGLAPTRD